jgi:abortive infection bacteriophage resistance protein
LATVQQPLLKPFRTFEEQLQILRDRGLQVDNDAGALATLQRVGYYRLAGYFYPLRRMMGDGTPTRRDEFVDGASLALVLSLYEFDKSLRLLVLDAIERLEVAIRVAIAYRLGRLHPEAHLDPRFLDARFCQARRANEPSAHGKWCQRLDEAFRKSSEDFVGHHRTRYQGRMPIWVAIELWDFGMLSFFYQGLAYKHRDAIARGVGQLKPDQLVSWLRTLNFVRNVCAHHSRLWNRSVPEVPSIPPADQIPMLAHVAALGAEYRLYGALSCMRYLLRSVHADGDWHGKLATHIEQFPQSNLVSLSAAGFPNNWRQQVLWA